ncbi:MAG: hypothetical protein LBB66_09390, partial [Desulfovibrio sp.]|nr:hypothetical protein [Desulfovibrio sp.]
MNGSPNSEFDALYRLCRASGGSAAVIESAVRGAAALRRDGEEWSHALSVLGLRVSAPLGGRVTVDADLG